MASAAASSAALAADAAVAPVAMHERVAVNAVRSHVNCIMFRISDGSVSRVRLPRGQPAAVGGLCDTDSSLVRQGVHELHSRNGRAQKLGRARHFLFLGPVDDYPASCCSAEPYHHCRCPPGPAWLPGPLTHLLGRSAWVLFPDGSRREGFHTQGKISSCFELYCSQTWAGLYLVKSQALQSSLAERAPAWGTTSQKRSRRDESREHA